MADGNDYNLIQLKEQGQPVEIVYPVEGTPLVTGPSGVLKAAPNPNAARLFQNWLHGVEGQQLLVDFARQYSAHALVGEAGRAQAQRDQADQGRPRRRREGRRGDQGALQQAVRRVIALPGRAQCKKPD